VKQRLFASELQKSIVGEKNGTIAVFVKGEADLLPFEELFRLKELYYFG
jgi:hypothetical protein